MAAGYILQHRYMQADGNYASDRRPQSDFTKQPVQKYKNIYFLYVVVWRYLTLTYSRHQKLLHYMALKYCHLLIHVFLYLLSFSDCPAMLPHDSWWCIQYIVWILMLLKRSKVHIDILLEKNVILKCHTGTMTTGKPSADPDWTAKSSGLNPVRGKHYKFFRKMNMNCTWVMDVILIEVSPSCPRTHYTFTGAEREHRTLLQTSFLGLTTWKSKVCCMNILDTIV